MPQVICPATTCTYNRDKTCLASDIHLKFRAAIDFPAKGTVVFFECYEQELPQDRENAG